jgi:glycerol-3-phosphate dehydrogenase
MTSHSFPTRRSSDLAAEGTAQMISVIGGKLTTAGSLARECAANIGVQTTPPTLTIATDESVDTMLERWEIEVREAGGLGADAARGIVEWYGRRAPDVAMRARGSAELRTPLCSHSTHIVAEAVDAFSTECATTLADVLLRRVPVALGACWSPSCSREAATRIGAVMGWTELRMAGEMEAFEKERAEFLQRVPPSRADPRS